MITEFFKKVKDVKTDLTTYGMGLLQAKAHRILKQHTASVLKQFDISTTDWALLGLLFDQPDGLRFSKAAAVLGVEAPFVTELADGLAKKDLLTELKLEQDKRVKILMLTRKGRDFVPKVETVLRNETKYLFGDASPSDIQTYRKVLKIIVGNAQASDEKQD